MTGDNKKDHKPHDPKHENTTQHPTKKKDEPHIALESGDKQ